MAPRRASTAREHRVRRLAVPILVRSASVAAGLGVWEWYGSAHPLTLPPFSSVVSALADLLGQSPFWSAIGQTLLTFLLGFVAAAVLGVALGILMAQIRPLGQFADFYLHLFLAVPLTGLVPLIVVGMGLGLGARVFVVFLFAFTEIALNSYAGVRYADRNLVEMAHAYLASKPMIFRRILLPSALPGVMVGLRIGVGNAVIGMVVAELLFVNVGLGRFVVRFEQTYQLANLFATILILLIFGALVAMSVQRFERLILRRYRD